MTVEQWLGSDNQIGIDIWNNKYRFGEESFDEWLDRVSGQNDQLRQLIIDKKFLFGGRILANRGLQLNQKYTLSNCYVIDGPEDNIESIYQCASDLARTYSYGGGCGIRLDKLAPRGAKVRNAAKTTSGAVSFMETFSQVTGQIGQDSRRGALMISLDCHHPDLEEFIDIKNDLDKVTKANISVQITDDFMRAVENDEDFKLSFTRDETGETIEKTINARKVFLRIAENNWSHAEPGCLFWDTIENYNLMSNNDNFHYAGVNPCLAGDTLIQTTEGLIPIKDLVDKEFDVYCMNNDGELDIAHVSKVWLTRNNAKTVSVYTGKGEITCTPDHKIYTTNRGWIAAKDLTRGDKIKGLNRSMKDETHIVFSLSDETKDDIDNDWYVKKVVPNDALIDVYDMEVPEYHNFIANNMVVHNCGEEPLPSYGSCLLGSLNLSAFVRDKEFQFDEYRSAIRIAIRALNTVLDEGLPLHPLKQQQETVRDLRQIGCGIFGLADMLIKLGIKYGSEESLVLCDKLGDILAEEALLTSNVLAKYYQPFPQCDFSQIQLTDFFKNHAHDNSFYSDGLCNSQLLTIAPTGTISTMLGVSGGIEPIYATHYNRKTESLHGKDETYKIYTPIIKTYMEETGIKDEQNLPDYFITAKDLNWKQRVDMQAVWQKHIDASISSTVNLPENTSPEEIFDLYVYAWKKKLKGITIYRDNCKRAGILSEKEKNNQEIEDTDTTLKRGEILPITDDEIGLKRTLQTGCGTLHCVGFFDIKSGDLREVFFLKGSTGGCLNHMIGLSRTMSIGLRGGVPFEYYFDQLMSSGVCNSYTKRTREKHDTSKGTCCPMAVGYALKEMREQIKHLLKLNCFSDATAVFSPDIIVYLPDDKKSTAVEKEKEDTCPECGAPMPHSGGCVVCPMCGNSPCS